MLAFDIETTGLDPAHSVVTVVCTQDFHTGERRAYEFGRVRACEPQNEKLLREELIAAFDEAESLCAFNGVRFDIPFLHTALRLPTDKTAAWLFKTTDILEAARLGLFGPPHTFGLNLLCQHNKVPVKSGSGLQAIKFAQDKRWDELLSYCADDVRILCDLYRRRLLNNPRFNAVIDLSKIAHSSTYAGDSTYAEALAEEAPNAPCSGTASQVVMLQTQVAELQGQVADLRQQVTFYQEHVFEDKNAEAALARLLQEQAAQQEQVLELRRKLGIYHEFCECL